MRDWGQAERVEDGGPISGTRVQVPKDNALLASRIEDESANIENTKRGKQ